jgi:hypothetical protein
LVLQIKIKRLQGIGLAENGSRTVAKLSKKQMKIAKQAPPYNKITKADFDVLRKLKKMR